MRSRPKKPYKESMKQESWFFVKINKIDRHGFGKHDKTEEGNYPN
jgi:hypothetical protein